MVALLYAFAARAGINSNAYFSNVGMVVISAVSHMLGLSLLAFMLAIKVISCESSFLRLMGVSWPRLLVVLNIIDAWAFLFTTGVLAHGAGLELSETVCLLGIINCIAFYASSKILIYLFLEAEKVYAVWGLGGRRRRLHCKIYMICLGFVFGYLGVCALLVQGRVAHFRPSDGACVIGLTLPASVTVLVYDLFVNVVLTSLFVWPLLRRDLTPTLRGVAIRSLWAAAVALTTSSINILVLTIMRGHQLGWVCLTSCGVDVVINAGVLCWITSCKYDKREHAYEHTSSDGEPKPLTDRIMLSPTTSGSSLYPSPRSTNAHRAYSSRPELGHARRHQQHVGGEGAACSYPEHYYASLHAATPPRDEVLESLRIMRPPSRSYQSTARRSNTSLSREPSFAPQPTGVQIFVTKETVTDMEDEDDPQLVAPPRRTSPSMPRSEPECKFDV